MATLALGEGSSVGRVRSVQSALADEWREVGGLGRLAAFGLVLSCAVAVGLGLWIQTSVHHHLLGVRTEMLQQIVDGLTADGLVPLGVDHDAPPGPTAAAIEHRLLGGEIVGVAIHDVTGATVFGEPTSTMSAAGPAALRLPHAEQHADGLLHLVLPVRGSDGRLVGSFEVSQESRSFDEVQARVRRNVWLSISTGLATLGIAMGAFTFAHVRALERRRRHSERLLRELLDVEDRQRRHIVGALHDDVGQPLYRILYGLEGCRARLPADHDVAREVDRLSGLVRDVDRTLRTELHRLHSTDFDTLDLASALPALAAECRAESGIDVSVDVDVRSEPTTVVRAVLLRAVQEALINVRKHADASRVTIRAHGDLHEVTVEVADDGCGPKGPPGLGLTTAAQRLEAAGGGLSLAPGSAGGAVLRAWVPAAPVVVR